MNPTRNQLRDLLKVVAATRPQEIDCDELLVAVGAYLEAAGPVRELSPDLRMVAQHLGVCPECREEYDALLAVYRNLPEG